MTTARTVEILPVRDVGLTDHDTGDSLLRWCECYPTIEHWLSPNDPPHAMFYLLEREFLYGLNILFRNSARYSYIVAEAQKQDRDPALMWCWMTAEHLSHNEMQSLVEEAAHCFHKKVGFAQVFHHDVRMAHLESCVKAVEHKADELTRGRAIAAFCRQLEARHEARQTGAQPNLPELPLHTFVFYGVNGNLITQLDLQSNDTFSTVSLALIGTLGLNGVDFRIMGNKGVLTGDSTLDDVTDADQRFLVLVFPGDSVH